MHCHSYRLLISFLNKFMFKVEMLWPHMFTDTTTKTERANNAPPNTRTQIKWTYIPYNMDLLALIISELIWLSAIRPAENSFSRTLFAAAFTRIHMKHDKKKKNH